MNFRFAASKLDVRGDAAEVFTRFIDKHQFRLKRNHDISHKELPETWSDHRYIHIPYRTIVRGVAMALRLMKKIDRAFLGPCAPYVWREARKKRYELTINPPRAGYMMIPYFRLSERDRLQIAVEESREGAEL